MPTYNDLNKLEKYELLVRASQKLGIPVLLLEKDYWVSWLLNIIFKIPLAEEVIFKGGTSLSKSYNIIKRFSEDVDLTIDTKILSNKNDAETKKSGKQVQKLLDENNRLAVSYIENHLKPVLENEIIQNLNDKTLWSLSIEIDEPKNLRFYYPSLIEEDSPYIKKSVLLEIGVRGKISPHEFTSVSSYVEDSFKDILDQPPLSPIKTLSPLRTFFEKLTLIHAENHRPTDKILGDRLSRHYYDLHQMIIHGYGKSALKEMSLLKDVIENKKINFRSAWTNYDKAIPGSLSIYPNESLINKLRTDYKQMKVMIFGIPPDFSEIMDSIQVYENEFNKVKSD